MTDFAHTWTLIRGRFDDAYNGLNQEQLNWRLHKDALTLGEMALHVAGVELSFISQLTGTPLDGFLARVARSATDGVVNEEPFPFSEEEIDPSAVDRALAEARAVTQPVIENPSSEILHRQIKSALGPMIDGTGALARLAYHPGYHQGQAHLIKTAPGFPG